MAADRKTRHADPGVVAAAGELRELNPRSKAGGRISVLDAEAAAQRAVQAHARARQAHLVAVDRHRSAAEAHDRAARMHREAAASGVGDVATHLRAVAVHEAARDDEYRAAAVAQRMAADE